MNDNTVKQRAVTGFIWRFCQNAGTQLVNFMVSIVLARILMPADYGLVAMISVFINIAMVFINTGFSSSIVQKKDLSETDKSTMFFASILMGVILYAVLFFSSPAISVFYKQPRLCELLRIEGLLVLICSFYSVHQALVIRNLEFKKSFMTSLSGTVVHGISGITMALLGFEVWALVFSTLLDYMVCAIVMWIVVKWRPKLVFAPKSFKSMFSFSFKILISGLIDSIFNNIRSIIIGRQYSSADLAYYNRGYQFPTLIMSHVDGSMTTVLFSSLSKFQSNWEEGLHVLRRAMRTSIFICAPLMAGMFAVSKPMILLLLTDKWADSVQYVRMVCVICIFWPLTAQRHALNSLGKSGVSLTLNIVGKIMALAAIFATYRISVRVMIMSTIATSFVSAVIGMIVYSKHLNYSVKQQLTDVVPSLLLAAFMGVCVWCVQLLNLPPAATLLIQLPVGFIVYAGLAKLLKFESFDFALNLVKGIIMKKKAQS